MPWIQEIKLPDVYSEIPNHSFFIDSMGTLFLGKENGLTIISGNRSEHLHMKGPVLVAGNGSDTVWYACPDDLGTLVRDLAGSYHMRSVKNWISRIYREFRPREFYYLNHALFLNTENGVYRLANGQTDVYPVSYSRTKLHHVGDSLLLQVAGEGFLSWSPRGFEPVSIEFPPAGSRDAFNFLEFLGQDGYLTVSEEEGIRIMDRNGRTLTSLGKRSGIPDLDIMQVEKYNGDELWILGAHSLHKVNQPSTMGILNMDPATTGRIYSSIVTGNGIYLGSNHGLFSVTKLQGEEGPWSVRRLSGVGSFHFLEKNGNMVFGAGTGGLISVADGRAEIISRGSFTGFTLSRTNQVITSNEYGLWRFDLKETGWDSVLIDGNLSGAHCFSIFSGQVFFLCDNGIFRLSRDSHEVRELPFYRKELLLRLLPMEDDLYLISDRQVYLYDPGEETFLPLEEDHKARLLSDYDLMIPDGAQGYWMVRHHGKYSSGVSHTKASDGFEEDDTHYPVLQNLGEIVDLNVLDSIIYVTGRDKISLFNLRNIDHSTSLFVPRIRRITEGTRPTDAGFYLAGLEFQSTPDPLFRNRLSPEYNEWSGWTTERSVFYERLRHGQYRIQVQAMDLFGRVTDISELSFSIQAPFYLRWYAYVTYSILFLVLLFIFRKWRMLSYQRAESRISKRMESRLESLTLEKEKSDRLVADILPEKTAAQLKSGGKAKWDKYERATVLFSDIQGFTRIAEEMNPEALIDELDKFFFHFDSVVEKYNIEKIKTIGDAYMAAGGIPEKNSTNPVEVVLAALEMQTYMQQLKKSRAKIWDLRIGVHTGPVIAGVVGHKKVSYDIWGDTVNTASRMESSGMPGKVNISGITYGMVKEYFICEYRGKLPVKYKGNIDMYFVTGLRPELSVDLKGIPNKRFFTKLQLLRLGDLEDRILGEFMKNLPEYLHFHSVDYARKVYDQSYLLCRAEEVEQDERLLVRTAALMLYTGLTQTYHNYENRSAVIAREWLPQFKYSERQIDQICNLILATKTPFSPNNQLEKILIDAKMEYVGRADYKSHAKTLFREMKDAGVPVNGQQFKKQQLELLHEFEYFTVAARRLREIPGQEQMDTFEQERWI